MSENKLTPTQRAKELASDSRLLSPKIVETKQELLEALRNGQIKSSKYNLLTESEKLLVELVLFGGYTAEQAVRVIDPSIENPGPIARRMMAKTEVVDTIEELSVSRDKKFMADINNARDMALSKLKYIMTTTEDDSLAAACAKTILDKASDITKAKSKGDEPVGNITFTIEVENNYVPNAKPKNDNVIIEIQPEEEARIINETRKELGIQTAELSKVKEEIRRKKEELGQNQVNPETGLPYIMSYEGINNYK